MLFRFPTVVIFVMTAGLANGAVGQTVQLPVFNYFSTSTSVMVPDGGAAYMGGVRIAASGRNSRGIPGLGGRPFTNTATATGASAGGVSVSAVIHDMAAMDEALLKQAAAIPMPARENQLATEKSPPVAHNATASIAGIRAQQAAEEAAQQVEARQYFESGEAAYAAGKFGAAKVFYQMCVRRATGELQTMAQEKLRQIAAPTPRVAGAKGE